MENFLCIFSSACMLVCRWVTWTIDLFILTLSISDHALLDWKLIEVININIFVQNSGVAYLSIQKYILMVTFLIFFLLVMFWNVWSVAESSLATAVHGQVRPVLKISQFPVSYLLTPRAVQKNNYCSQMRATIPPGSVYVTFCTWPEIQRTW